jgi:hypothetical protein
MARKYNFRGLYSSNRNNLWWSGGFGRCVPCLVTRAAEDSLPMAQYLAESMNVPVTLIDRPWNRSDDWYGQISRYRNWEELAAAMPGKIDLTRR